MPPEAAFRSLFLFDDKHPLFPAYRLAKRIIIGIVGGTVLLIGIAMIVLPGPALVVIPVGLGILSLEFAWALALAVGRDTWIGPRGSRAAAPPVPPPAPVPR